MSLAQKCDVLCSRLRFRRLFGFCKTSEIKKLKKKWIKSKICLQKARAAQGKIYPDLLWDTLIFLETSEIAKCQMVNFEWNHYIKGIFLRIYVFTVKKEFKSRLPIREKFPFPAWPQSYFEMYLERITTTNQGRCGYCARRQCYHKYPLFDYLRCDQDARKRIYAQHAEKFNKTLLLYVSFFLFYVLPEIETLLPT